MYRLSLRPLNCILTRTAIPFIAHYRSIHTARIGKALRLVVTDESAPAASLSVVVRGGSKYETAGQVGTAHYLKNYAFKSTHGRTALRITRESEILGGALSAAITRDSIIYTAQFLPVDLPNFANLLCDCLYNTRFAAHEFSAIQSLVEFESARAHSSPTVAALEALYSVAFARPASADSPLGLANGLYAPHGVPMSVDAIKSYADAVLGNGIAVVSSGLSRNEVHKAVEEAFAAHATSPATSASTALAAPSFRAGAETCINDASAEHVHVAFATPVSNRLHGAVVAQLLGGATHIKWSHGGETPLAQAVRAHDGLSAMAFHLPHPDATLLSVLIKAPARGAAEAVGTIKRAVNATMERLAGGIEEGELKRAVAKARMLAATGMETREGRLSAIESALFVEGGVERLSAEKMMSELEGLKVADISATAREIKAIKPAAAAHGPSAYIPHFGAL